ncbi:aminoglycoside phosphotransferase family protein [Phytomonospora endophytica]|uniref:Aminoglycoside phosphotransferase (APT) family kinase protein n=1 Tax=Phytomonospora endophytica TaxID=714109 RepID=A0A841FPF0_9ACTN|nr:aminoglycoside phosphotransferase family protein [Phytomonospora endophytica]MBB6037704.1 aminoglycoside phosphotransferase (APT) family kinase protein [Phytomonospora endophytica]GIG67767.1 aminoglycoside phosphotransferase [Phytomonospora endophytica]
MDRLSGYGSFPWLLAGSVMRFPGLPEGDAGVGVGISGRVSLTRPLTSNGLVYLGHMSTSTHAPFSEQRARALALEAAAQVGGYEMVMELIRMGEHAMFRLPGGVVARVARGPGWAETAAREIRVARLLERHGVPCGRPAAPGEPVTIDGHPVTFWEELDTSRRATFAEIGEVLRDLHAVPVADLDLPVLDAFHRVGDRIAGAPISEGDRADLQGVLEELEGAWAALTAVSPMRLIHGDPHSGNVAHSAGHAVLIDLETVCLGPAEWDLALPGTYFASLGWLGKADYEGFVRAYGGRDVTVSPHFQVLRRIRELRMTSWLIQHAGESEELAAQARHRVACLVDDRVPRVWSRR